jgi:hypothetical protein
MAMSSLTYIPGFSVKFFFQPISPTFSYSQPEYLHFLAVLDQILQILFPNILLRKKKTKSTDERKPSSLDILM